MKNRPPSFKPEYDIFTRIKNCIMIQERKIGHRNSYDDVLYVFLMEYEPLEKGYAIRFKYPDETSKERLNASKMRKLEIEYQIFEVTWAFDKEYGKKLTAVDVEIFEPESEPDLIARFRLVEADI